MMQVICEPFTNIYGGLQSKTTIENLFKVSITANEGLKKTISFENNKEDIIIAIGIFEHGGSIKGKSYFPLRLNQYMTSVGGRKSTH